FASITRPRPEGLPLWPSPFAPRAGDLHGARRYPGRSDETLPRVGGRVPSRKSCPTYDETDEPPSTAWKTEDDGGEGRLRQTAAGALGRRTQEVSSVSSYVTQGGQEVVREYR